MDTQEVKTCTSCDLSLPLSKFKKRGATGRQSHTYHSMCNRCLYIKYTRPLVDKKTKEIHDFQLEKGCADCGFNKHPAAMEFDHMPGHKKLFNISEHIGSKSKAVLWAEIAKCEVVCANCHAIRTANRRERVEIHGKS